MKPSAGSLSSILLFQHDAHSFAVLVEKDARGDAQHQQHDQLSQGNAASLHEEVDEVEAQAADEEEVDLKADDNAVEDRRHQKRQERDVLDPDISQQIHHNSGKQRSDRSEDHIVEAQPRRDRADVRDHTADRQPRNRRRGIDREHGEHLRYTKLYRHRGRAGDQQILSDRQHRVHRCDGRCLCQKDEFFVFHIHLSPLVLV